MVIHVGNLQGDCFGVLASWPFLQKFERWLKVSDVINGGLLFESCGDLQIYQHQSQSRLEHPSWSMYFCLSDPKQDEFQWTIVVSFLSSVVNMSMPQYLRYNEKKSTIFRRLWHIFVVCSFLKDVFQEKWWMSVGISAKEAIHSDVFWRQSLKNWFKIISIRITKNPLQI